MGIILDTSAVVELERKGRSLESFLPDEVTDLYLPTLVLAELWIGIELASNDGTRQLRRGKVLALMAGTTPIPFDEELAPTYAKLYAALRAKGIQIPSNDLAIAATALHHGHEVLVGSCDEAHFRSVPGLKVRVLAAPTGS